MARTTIANVTLIMSSVPVDGVVTKFIESANLMVTEVIGSDTTLSSDLKADIECWLTAHMIAITLERMPASAGAAGADIKFLGKSDIGLGATPYGQMVMELDSTGKFRSLNTGKRVRIRAITSFDD